MACWHVGCLTCAGAGERDQAGRQAPHLCRGPAVHVRRHAARRLNLVLQPLARVCSNTANSRDAGALRRCLPHRRSWWPCTRWLAGRGGRHAPWVRLCAASSLARRASSSATAALQALASPSDATARASSRPFHWVSASSWALAASPAVRAAWTSATRRTFLRASWSYLAAACSAGRSGGGGGSSGQRAPQNRTPRSMQARLWLTSAAAGRARGCAPGTAPAGPAGPRIAAGHERRRRRGASRGRAVARTC